jgi:methylglutamate dehydrogenase subunit C
MSARPTLMAADRPILVGLKALDAAALLSAGAHLIATERRAVADHDEGIATSVAYSPTLGHEIGLGFLKRGQQRLGDRIRAVDLLRNRDVACEVVDPVFIDAKGERLRG